MAATQCFYCGKRESDRASAHKTALWNDAGNHQIIEVPRCPSCQGFHSRLEVLFYSLLLGSFLIGFGIPMLISNSGFRRALSIDTSVFTPATTWFGGFAVFLVLFLSAWLSGPILEKAKGIKSKAAGNTHSPEVLGWKSKGYTRFAPPPAGIQKTCGACGKPVPASAAPGSRCPHCGKYWSSQQNR